MIVPVPVMGSMPMPVVQVVDVIGVGDGVMAAAGAVLVVMPLVGHVPTRLALVVVVGVQPVQMAVVRVVDVVAVRHLGMAAGGAVDVVVDGVFVVERGHDAHLRRGEGLTLSG